MEGFQLDVIDYLVKPITFNRFFKAATKANDYHQLVTQAASQEPLKSDSGPGYFFIKCDYKYERIYFDDILYIEAMQNYVTIYTTKGKYMTLLYLKNIEDKLQQHAFIRIHKSYLVQIKKIDAIENNEVVIGKVRLPISRDYRNEVIERVVNDRLGRNKIKDTSVSYSSPS